jgi:glycine oxidase
MSEHGEVLILGGGVIGLTTAFFLAEVGVDVVLVDRGDLGRQASWAGAGILTPGDPKRCQTPGELIRALGSAAHQELSAQLQERTGIDNGYRRCGGLEIPEEGEPAAGPTEEWLGAGAPFTVLDRGGIEQLEPALAPHITRAFHLPTMAQVRNPRHLKALIAACTSLGVRLVPHCPVQRIQRQGERVLAVETSQGRLQAGQYLLAAGAWTPELARDLGWQPAIVPVRGQIALLNTNREGARPLLLHGKRYLVPRGDGLVLAGSTEERVGFDARPTAGGVGELLAFAEHLVPSLRQANLERCWAGLRPGSPDGQPFLGRLPGLDNLFVAAGHFRAGIQLSPITGRLMTQLLLGRPTEVDLEAFRPERVVS